MPRYIDADKLKAHYAWWGDENGTELSKRNKEVFDAIVDLQPSVEIVHCGECKRHTYEEPGMVYCPHVLGAWETEDFFCGHGERREEE